MLAIYSVLLIIGTSLLVYSNNYHNEFIFDDFVAIVDNPDIRSFSSIGGLLHPDPDGGPLAARPIPALTLAFNYAISGLDVWSYHLVNNLIHVLVALLIFGLIRQTLTLPAINEAYGYSASCYGLAVALLWLVHPLNSETVNYIICRTESLVGLFYLATLFFAATSFKDPVPRKWQISAVIACALGMASKEVMVSAPLLVLIYDRTFVAGSFKKALLARKGFYAALASTWLVVGFYQLDDPRADSVLFDSDTLTVKDYFLTQTTVIVHYLKLSLWPDPLVLDNQDWPIAKGLNIHVAFSLTLLLAMGIATLVGLLRKTWWAILGVWFFFILGPTSSFIPILTEIVAERRMYLPLIGIIILMVFSFGHYWRFVSGKLGSGPLILKGMPILLLLVIVLAGGMKTYERNRDYRTAVSIWTDTVKKRPNNSRAHENLAKALVRSGRFAEAIVPFQEAISLYPPDYPKPELAEIYSSLGSVLSQSGRFAESVMMHRKAITILPGDAVLHYQLGNAYLRVNDLDRALLSFRRALELSPTLVRAHGNLGIILMMKGDLSGAEEHLRRVVQLAPDDWRSYVSMGDLRVAQQKYGEAEKFYRQALVIDPGNTGLVDNLQRLQVLKSGPGTDTIAPGKR